MNFDQLRSEISGVVLTADDDGFAAELAGAHLDVVHTPDVVIGVASEADVATALRYAQQESMALAIQSTGHGPEEAVTGGMMITTKRLNEVSIDPETRIATLGAGTIWSQVLDAAAVHGLTAIAGSSPNVGTVGYTLGGGVGPLIRSHGFTSDWAREFTVVVASGETITASSDEHEELFWALRGGKGGFGVVTRMKVELVPLATIYAGALYFDGPHLETALRGWTEWTATAPHDVTTSVAVTRFPPFDEVPEPFRGKVILAMRFAYPGDAEEGARLAEGLRSVAPVYVDQLAELPTEKQGLIHNDPPGPGLSWSRGQLLTTIDQEFVAALLDHVGPEKETPFVAVEVRQFGGQAKVDVPEGSAVGGRSGDFNLFVLGVDPAWFELALPRAAEELLADLSPWVSPESNVNFAGAVTTRQEFERNWPAATVDRLQRVRAEYDPDRVFAYGPRDR